MTTDIITRLFDYLERLYCKLGKDYEKYKETERVIDKSFGKFISEMESVYNDDSYIPNTIFVDYISGMTDNFALSCIEEISIPKALRM